MPNVRIGKYKRPGIFLEEYDQSIIVSPEVEGITNLVMGISRKGPYNTPIRVTGLQEFEALYGSIDRNLERKGSFFHRTVVKMLETAPVYALNILMTDDELDKAEFQSLSTATCGKNGEKREGAYRRYFDTTGFWKRDTEAFLYLAKSFDEDEYNNNSHALSITNLSGKPISVFIVKTKRTGFDRTVLEWYGGKDKMPSYLNERDYASDYMVDVIVVGGEWTNYGDLSVDPRWSQYFSRKGLRKNQIDNFANDNTVNLLAYYNGVSLIPYFRDQNGQNIFIETVINRETDRTGLFCTIDYDMIEQDIYTGNIDLLGHNLAVDNDDCDNDHIKFLSYDEKIVENVLYKETPLDLPGNVFAIGSTTSSDYNSQPDHAFGGGVAQAPTIEGDLINRDRTYWFAEQAVYGVTRTLYTGVGGTTHSKVEYEIDKDAYAVIGGRKIDLNGTTSSITESFTYDIEALGQGGEYTNVYYITNQGELKVKDPNAPGMNPEVNETDLVLGYTVLSVTMSGGTASLDGDGIFNDISVDTNGYIEYTDFNITNVGNDDKVTFEFEEIDNSNRRNYIGYRNYKFYKHLLNMLTSHRKNGIAMLLDGSKKYNLKDIETEYSIESKGAWANVYAETGFNKFEGIIEVDFNDPLLINETEYNTFITNQKLVLYDSDNELIPGKNGAISSYITPLATTDDGIIGKQSTFYRNYYDGIINTGDVIYNNIAYANGISYGDDITAEFLNGESSTYSHNDYHYRKFVLFDKEVFDISGQNLETIRIFGSKYNERNFTLIDNQPMSPNDLAKELYGPSTTLYAYEVEEDVVDERDIMLAYTTIDGKYKSAMIQNRSEFGKVVIGEIYISDTNDDIYVEFDGEYGANNSIFYVRSGLSNLKQTLELEIPSDNPDYYNEGNRQKNQVIVSTHRYTEVRPGDFLLADVEEDDERKMTRIISKRRYSTDPNLTVLTTDASIKVNMFDDNGQSDYQTMTFTEIDKYVKEYKALSFKGFRVRNESLPDGTEERQTQILNMVAKGTPLFKALTNKDSFVFRYLIDSFGLGLTEFSKQQLMDITGERLDAFTFLNMPSVKSFKNSGSPTFIDSEGVIDFEYVAQGGDYDSSPAFLYSFGEGRGASTAGYFLPYLTVNDNGRPINIPPASYVATTFMRKHLSNITSVTPWTVAAGIRHGKITGIVGTEQEFGLEDIEHLNMAMMNPIVYKRNRGYVIETENTAQTLYKSALSYIHVREVLIELEQELAAMLLDYQWRYNTPDVRAEIKLRADVICETYVARNGIYNFFNKMDEENNTTEIIDNQMGVLDTYVEPIRAMGVIVNNVTILGTGAIDSGGFIM